MISTEPVSHPAEVPVTVHASRTTQGARIHEETRTVAVTAEGAVVRLKAKLPPGELVVLTNAQSHDHVVCRVKHPKGAQRGAGCVDLEFIKPTPGFWGEAIPREGSADALTQGDVPAAAQAQPGGVPEEGLRAQSRRTPVWQQRREIARAATPPAARGETAALRARAPLAVGAASQQPMAAGGMLPAARPHDEDRVDSASRSSNTKLGALILVAAISIVNGAVFGSWFQRRAATADAAEVAVEQPLVPQFAMIPSTEALSAVALRGSDGVPASFAAEGPAPRSVASAAPVRRPVAEADIDAAASLPASETAEPSEEVAPRNLVIDKLQAPRVRKAPTIAQSDAPVVVNEARDLNQAGTALRLLTGSATNSAPPRPAPGGRLIPLQLISSPPAVYPTAARAQGIRGVVTLDVLVDETGKVAETNVTGGHPLLQEAAKVAVGVWRYQPARLNGQPIKMRTKVSVRFDLK